MSSDTSAFEDSESSHQTVNESANAKGETNVSINIDGVPERPYQATASVEER